MHRCSSDISQGKVATHLRCSGIFSGQCYYKCSSDSDSKISVKIGQYLMKLKCMKLRRTKNCASFFGPPCISDCMFE